ncbi:MAG: amidohydrolase family protein [Thermoplasmata archaeon]
MIVAETPDGEQHEMFVIDYHTHVWNASRENWLREDLAKGWINCFYDYHTALTPPDYVWDYETYLYYGEDRAIEDLFSRGHVDMAIFQPTQLKYFYKKGFGDPDETAPIAMKHPDRFVMGSRWDPREGEAGKAKLKEHAANYRPRPFHMRNAKLYTAEWMEDDGGVSRGWRLDSREAIEFLELNRDLGITIQVPHKGPTVWPLDKDAFDVGDVDVVATMFPDLKFLVTHIGLPRLEDFAWIATQDKNVYAGMAVAMAFIHTRPRYFAKIMAELLYWLGSDRIVFGSDYALWHPKWIVEDFLQFELPEDLKKEYGVDLTMEDKKKILGENAAALWGIDIAEMKDKLRNDDIAKKFEIKPAVIPLDGGKTPT